MTVASTGLPDWITAGAAVAALIASGIGIAISVRALHVAKRSAAAAEISATADRNDDLRQRAPGFTLEPEGAYANAEVELTLDTASPLDKVEFEVLSADEEGVHLIEWEGANVATGNFGPFSLGKSVRFKVGRAGIYRLLLQCANASGEQWPVLLEIEVTPEFEPFAV
jgi:hypothetical protein